MNKKTKIMIIKSKIIKRMLVCTLICAMIATRFSCVSFDFSSAETKEETYISEIKLFEAETEKEAEESMKKEEYLPVKKDGKIIDINKDCGDEAGKEYMPIKRVVYMGYKTTTDPDEAITDMAVMNMNGGYSVDDYDKLLKDNMESKIIPFIKGFIATIKEFRENYKSSNKKNKIRALNCYKVLNRFTDPDTNGKLGDLFLNKTKFELGDEYDKLSSKEKKKHADILTILTEGNSDVVMAIKKALLMGADSAKTTWVQRMTKIKIEDLENEAKDELEEENIKTTQTNIDKRLNEKYNDVAKIFLDKWDDFSKVARDYEDVIEDFEENEVIENNVEEVTKEYDGNKNSVVEVANYINEKSEAMAELGDNIEKIDLANEASELDEKKYGKGTLNDFFAQPKKELEKKDNIKKLYPMVAALSKGQRVGADLFEIKELMDVGLGNFKECTDEELECIPKASVYVGINRELFKTGNVAITDDAMRKEASKRDLGDDEGVKNLTLGIAIFSGVIAFISAVLGFNEYGTTLVSYNYGEFMMDSIDDIPTRSIKPFVIASSIMAIMTIVFTIIHIVEENEYKKIHYNKDYKKIPKYMIDRKQIVVEDEENGSETVFPNHKVYYKAVESNREPYREGKDNATYKSFYDKRYKEIGNMGDLKGTIGLQWVALYTVKDPVGAPILADSIDVLCGRNVSLPQGSEYLHLFGESSRYDLHDNKVSYGTNEPTYIVFKRSANTGSNSKENKESGKSDKDPGAAGTIVSGKNNVLAGGLGFIVGGIVGAFVMFASRRKKKKA